MTNEDRAALVAASLQTMMSMLDTYFDALVGENKHNIVLVVNAGDVSQYISNLGREQGMKTIQSLLARWGAGVPDILVEATPGDLGPTRHLLAELERCLNEDARGLPHVDPRLTTEDARENLLAYVGEQVAKASRGAPAA